MLTFEDDIPVPAPQLQLAPMPPESVRPQALGRGSAGVLASAASGRPGPGVADEPPTAEGFRRVRIVVSGGFDAERVRRFEAAGVPVDSYGVGSSLLRGSADFTADVVELEGRPCAKVGRGLRPNPRLQRVY